MSGLLSHPLPTILVAATTHPQVYLQAPSTLQPSFLQTVGLSSFVFGSASRSDIHPILPSSLCLKIQPDLCGFEHIPRAGATGAQQAARPWAGSPEPEARSPSPSWFSRHSPTPCPHPTRHPAKTPSCLFCHLLASWQGNSQLRDRGVEGGQVD